MKPHIASDCETVEAVFARRQKLRVPYFQRGYAWQQEHAARLISDLVFHASGRAPMDWYPLGSIILSHVDDQGEVDVADGHQRLITLTILLAALRDREPDESQRARLTAASSMTAAHPGSRRCRMPPTCCWRLCNGMVRRSKSRHPPTPTTTSRRAKPPLSRTAIS